jgi:signal transduction histidine kinase
MISYFAFSGLLNFIVSLFLGILVYLKGRKIFANKIFVLDTLSVALWSFGYFFWQVSTDFDSALFWSRVLMAGAIFIPLFYFHFILCFLDSIHKNQGILYVSYGLAIFLSILNFTPYFVKTVEPTLFFPFWPKPGIFYPLHLLLFFGLVSYGWYLLIKELKKIKEKTKKQQIKYFLLGTGIGFVCGSTNYFLWYNIPIPPYPNALVSIYVVLTTFAILKYHLFEIRVVLTEILVGVMGVILTIFALVGPTLTANVLRFLSFFVLFLFLIFAYYLVKSVHEEERRRKEAERISQVKSEFIAIASHQLRTPLTAIKGYLSMILEGDYGKLPAKIKEKIENVLQSSERVIRLVNSILDVSKIEAGEMEMNLERADLREIIREVINELSRKAKEKNLYLKFEEPKEFPKILLDREKIRQVILNLIDNAIRYTQKGGVTVKLQMANDKLQIVISDTGEGLTKEEKEKLFERFSRGTAGTKFWTEGAGLGLYIARRFVEMHKGKIWVESEGREKGSTFYVELPVR